MGDPLSGAQPGQVEMTVGYTDPVIAIAQWPSTTVGWSVGPPAGATGSGLTFRVAMQPAGLIPGGTSPGDAVAAAAAETAGRFAAVWYQIVQPDMQVTLATSLNQTAPDAAPPELPVPIDGLRLFAAGSYAFAASAGAIIAAFADPAAAPSLADVITHYGTDWQALGLAAGERPCGELMAVPATGLNIPAFAVFDAGGTVGALVPEPLDPAAVLADPDNIVLPLNPGVELLVPSDDKPQPEDGLSLRVLSARLNITPASLVTANKSRPALLAPGFVFEVQGVEVEVPAEADPGADATLDDIALAFRNNGVPFDAVMAAVANADTPGMFRTGAVLAVERQIIAPGWTLADNTTGVDVETLAAANVETIDLFAGGTPVFLQALPVTGLETAPLGAAARAYAIEPGDLLRHNAGLAPASPDADGAGLPVPGLAALPGDPGALRIPYKIAGSLTMTQIAAMFVSAAPGGSDLSPEEALTEANRALPGTIAGGRTLTVAGQALPTEAGDSFDDVIARADPPVTLSDFAATIADDAGALAPGAMLLCPPARLPSEDAMTPAALEAAYGLDAVLIMSANAATRGVILAGVTLKPSTLSDTPVVVTAPDDSLNAILRRFAASGAAVTIKDVVQANAQTAFLAPGATLLLPPADAVLQHDFGTDGWVLPGVIFPVRSWITLKREPGLVDPAFRGTQDKPGAAMCASSPIAATRSAAPERQEDGAYTLDVFAAAIETAIPGLKLATGRVLSAERDLAPTDIWAVSFLDPGGISQVKIEPVSDLPGVEGKQPLSFALRPLSNTLQSDSGVRIQTLDPQTGGWTNPQIYDYQGIDLEVWARSFLSGLDLMCTAPYAAPAYRVAPDSLALLLAAKKKLACAVADGLSAILADQDASGGALSGPAWTAAREVVYQRLLSRLAPGYDITAVLQFASTVSSTGNAASARLVGAGKLREPAPELKARQSVAGQDPDAWKDSQLGNAKTSLAATAAGTVSFPLDVSQPARHRSVALEPVYAVNEIEFAVTPVTAGYESSNWLSFVRPFDRFAPPAFSADLGAPLAPVPLRAYPELPALISQTAQTASAPLGVEDALLWAYVFTYTHKSAAQDQILLEVEFNRRPPLSQDAAPEDVDTLFRALAQYASASDTLWQLLAGLQNPDLDPDDAVLFQTLRTYADLAKRVSDLWAAWWGIGTCDDDVAARAQVRPAHTGLIPPTRRAAPQPEDAPQASAPHEFYHYLATLDSTVVDGVEVYATLTLQRLSADGQAGWPAITVIREDGKAVELTGGSPAGETRIYSFPQEPKTDLVPAFSRISVRCTINDLHIARYQNASSAVSVIRNAQLLGPGGPQTCTAFVYSTPQLGFPEPLAPLITISGRLDIGPWTSSPATNPLTPLFNAMFDGDPADREIAVAIRYGYTLAPSDPPIETQLPVALRPRFEYDPGTTVQSIITAVDNWAALVQPVTGGGLWSFGLSLYSSTDPALDRPLLELQRVVSPLA